MTRLGSNQGTAISRQVNCQTSNQSASDDRDELVEDERSVQEVDIVVAHIKRLARRAGLEFALSVGSVIIHHFYDGDANAWRARGPKSASFRRLARHPELPLSPGSLYRCVALFELCDRLNAPSRWDHLGASHLRVVLGLPNGTQERLLAMANAQRWSVRALHTEALRAKSGRVNRGGRRAEPPMAKTLLSVKRSLQDSCSVIAQIAELSDDDIKQSMRLVDEARSCLDGLFATLRAAVPSDPAELGVPKISQ